MGQDLQKTSYKKYQEDFSDVTTYFTKIHEIVEVIGKMDEFTLGDRNLYEYYTTHWMLETRSSPKRDGKMTSW